MWHDHELAAALLEFTDTLSGHFDALEFAGRLALETGQLLGVGCTGVTLTDGAGALQVAGSSDATAHLLQAIQLRRGEGPCVECHRSGRAVAATDLTVAAPGWPTFRAACVRAGFRSVQVVPMRRHEVGVGTLSLFLRPRGPVSAEVSRTAQSLADAATIGILQQRSRHHREVLAGQLQQALDSRIIIEQAKGVLAERLSISPAEAFERIRRHARGQHSRLHDVARGIVDGSIRRTADGSAPPVPEPQRAGDDVAGDPGDGAVVRDGVNAES